jgi:hypothetical protein
VPFDDRVVARELLGSAPGAPRTGAPGSRAGAR